MVTFLRAMGWFLWFAGGALCLMGLMTLPDGGLMFALPYVFLIPGLCMVFFGFLLLQIRRRESSVQRNSGDEPGRE
jgi:membrane protein implicated in regulation of membrane protease activity